MSTSSVLARTFKLTKKTKGPYNPELINYVRKLRTEEPRRWTPKAVSKKFNIPEGQVELLTPKYILKEKVWHIMTFSSCGRLDELTKMNNYRLEQIC